MKKIVDHTMISQKNIVVYSVALFVLLVLAAFPIYGWLKGISTPSWQYFFLLMMIVMLLERISGKYTYELEKKTLVIKKRGLFNSRTLVINLKNLIGIYDYQPKLVRAMRFRRTFRMHSALDARQVWTIAYKVINKKGKEEYWQVYFKPSREMLEQLHELYPSKVMVPEEEALAAALLAERHEGKERKEG